MENNRAEILANKIEDNDFLEDDERHAIARLLRLLSQATFEKSGAMFIAGVGGQNGDDGLPPFVYICPKYGSDILQMYKKV